MRKGVVPALGIAMTMTAILSARSDEIPTLDVGASLSRNCESVG